MKLLFNAPINSLSFGQVTFNLLKEMHKKNVDLTFFPIAANMDFKAFPKPDDGFEKWFGDALQNRFTKIKRDTPSLKLWHINGSESKLTDRQVLFTFYELSAPTPAEVNLLNQQAAVIVTSNYTKRILESNCVKNVHFVPLGFDDSFHRIDKKYVPDSIVHFGLVGKWEKRKHTEKIIKLWVKKYGDNPKYRLTCSVTNPFIQPEQMNGIIGQALEGKRYFNVTFLPYLTTNREMNDLYNAIDVDLSGLSGAEGFGIPAATVTSLSKWSIVLNATAHQDWATKDNCILVEPNGTTDAYDGVFFKQGMEFNQGNIFTFDDNEVIAAMELAEKKAKIRNTEGEKLVAQFPYSRTYEEIEKVVQKI